MSAVFRAPMRARDRDVDTGADEGLRGGHVGIGDGPTEKDARMAARLADLPDGTFVWTRDSGGAYWLGRIDGPYRREPDREDGIVHLRAARWQDAPVADVPEPVLETFRRGGRNLQRINAAGIEARTAALWAAG